jgi:hypothetical protein
LDEANVSKRFKVYKMLSIVSAPKAFDDEHVSRIQRNALRSWLALGSDVEVLLLGDEAGIPEIAETFGVRCSPVTMRAKSGAPLINELFALARQQARYETVCYLNADIILMEDFLPSVQIVMERFPLFLIVGNRVDLEMKDELHIQENWREDLHQKINEVGKPHPPMGSDYFIYRKGQFADMPSFALGRAGWDNWMMYKARHSRRPDTRESLWWMPAQQSPPFTRTMIMHIFQAGNPITAILRAA